jgi:hypothetical protein
VVKSVICFFPGAGGNRYIRYLQNEEYQTPHMSYDHLIRNQSVAYRYLMEKHYDLPQNEIILTHCMNQIRIREVFGSEVNITVLHFPLQSCLRREWLLSGRDRYITQKNIFADNFYQKKIECYNAIKDHQWPNIKNLRDYELLPKHIKQEVDDKYAEVIDSESNSIEYNSAIETIRWHRDYYARYPLDISDCMVLHLNDDDEFCRIMYDELELYQNHVFDQAWQTMMHT